MIFFSLHAITLGTVFHKVGNVMETTTVEITVTRRAATSTRSAQDQECSGTVVRLSLNQVSSYLECLTFVFACLFGSINLEFFKTGF